MRAGGGGGGGGGGLSTLNFDWGIIILRPQYIQVP